MSENVHRKAEVVPFRQMRGQPGDFPTLKEKVQGYQSLIRLWRLKGATQTVALHVLDRTLGWGKREGDFVNAEIAAATGLADSTVRLALKKLYELGCLKKMQYDGHRTTIAVDGDWRPDAGNEAAPVSGDLTADRERTDRPKSANAEPLLDSGTIGKQKHQYSAMRSGPGEAGGDVFVSRKPPPNIGWRAGRPTDPKPLPVPALHEAWREEWAKTFRDQTCPTWGPREFGIAKRLVVRLAKNFHSPPMVQEKIREVVRRWRWIGTKKFPWMKNKPYPVYPDIGFVLRYWVQMDLAVRIWPSERLSKDENGDPVYPEEFFKPLPFTSWEEHPVTKMEERNAALSSALSRRKTR